MLPHTVRPGWIACCLVGAASILCPAVSFAQLRTGRADRSLYQEELQSRQYKQHHAASNRAVTTASYQSQYTILEQAETPQPSMPQQPRAPQRIGEEQYGSEAFDARAPASEMESGYWDDTLWNDGYSSQIACDSCGCGGSGCNICFPAGSLIAPCATGTYTAGCNPLLWLWCRLQVRAEVPLYWRRDQGAPSLVTTSPTGTDADAAGELGRTTTNVLFGNSSIRDQSHAGFRLTLNTWLTADECYGLMFRYWNAGELNDTTTFDSNSFPILARPFFNTSVAGAFEQDAQLIAFPNESVGSIRIDNDSTVDGLELTLRRRLYKDRFTRLDWLWGYQHLSIDEGLTVFSNTTVTGNVPGLQGASISVTDRFQTENDFHGTFYGLMNTRSFACWKMETMFRLGLGNLRRQVNIAGTTTTASGGSTNTENQGLLARNTNSQPFRDDTFVVLPEVGINFAYCIRPGLDFNFGYNYMLIPKVAQPAQQIDNNLSVNLSDPLVGALDPSLDFDERNYWLHSIGLGLQLRY